MSGRSRFLLSFLMFSFMIFISAQNTAFAASNEITLIDQNGQIEIISNIEKDFIEPIKKLKSLQQSQDIKNWPSKKNVEPKHKWAINFNQTIDKKSLSKDNIFIMQDMQRLEETELLLSNDGKSIEVTAPAEGYIAGETYTLHISKQITANAGQQLKKSIEMQFTIKKSDKQDYYDIENIESFIFTDKESFEYIYFTAVAGDAIHLNFKDHAGAIDYTIYSRIGDTKEYAWHSSGKYSNVSSGVSHILKEDNEYVILVKPANSSWFSNNEIKLTYKMLRGDTEEFDTSSSSRKLESNGEESFTLHAMDDIDYFEVTANAGQALYLDFTGHLGDMRYSIYKYNKDMKRWDQQTKGVFYTDSTAKSHSINDEGQYLITLTPHNEKWFSSKKINMTYKLLTGDSAEPDSSKLPRKLQSSGQTNFTLHSLDDIDYFLIEGKAGEALYLDFKDQKGSLIYTLYSENKEMGIWEQQSVGTFENGAKPSAHLLETDGEYLIAVKASFSNWFSTDEITLMYELLEGDSGELDSSAKPRKIINNGQQFFTLHAGDDIDYYSFEAKKGEILNFDFEKNLKDLYYNIYRKNSDMNKWDRIASRPFYVSSTPVSLFIQQDGEYLVTVKLLSDKDFSDKDITFIHSFIEMK